jgi:hypothetical protein
MTEEVNNLKFKKERVTCDCGAYFYVRTLEVPPFFVDPEVTCEGCDSTYKFTYTPDD